MTHFRLRTLAIAFLFLYTIQSQAVTRGARAPQPPGAKPAPTKPAGTPETRLTYFTCSGAGKNGPVNVWMGDYQGKQYLRITGKGVSSMSRDYHVPITLGMRKSADGKQCNVVAARANGSKLDFSFPMALGPNHIHPKTTNGAVIPCSSYQTAASPALSACTTPNVLTRATMPASCVPAGPSVNEQAYGCQVIGQFTRKPASTYSMKYCQLGPRGSEARTDFACVAKVVCNRKQTLSRAAFEAVKEWPKQYDSYISCRPGVSGMCDKSVDECRADKSIYFANKDRGEAAIRIDVGLNVPTAAAIIAAPAPAATLTPVTPPAPASVENDPWRVGDVGSPQAAPVRGARVQQPMQTLQEEPSFGLPNPPSNARQRFQSQPRRTGAQ